MDNMSSKFGLPQSLLDAVRNIQKEETEYQAKVKALMKKKGITSLGQLSPDEKKAFFNQLDSMHQAKNEETELEESDLPSTKEKQKTVMVVHKTSGKELKIQASALDKYKAMGYKLMEETEIEEGKSGTGYELYHKDFSSAMQHAYDFAKKKYNIEIDPFEIDRNVAMGPKKPSSGKANAYRLLDKTGKKAIQVQVTNLDNKRYELNMYKEDLDLEESGGPVVYKKGDDHIEKYGDEKFAVYKNGKKTNFYKSMDDAKAALEEAKDEGASKEKETQFHSKLDKLVHKTFGKRPEEMKEQEKGLPFTPDKKKKNPGVVPGKYGAGPSIAKHLAKMGMKQQMDKKKPVKEEELDELKKSTLGSYVKKRTKQLPHIEVGYQMAEPGRELKGYEKLKKKVNKGINRAVDRLAKEEVEQIEEGMSATQIKTLRDAYAKIDKIDVSGQPYKNLVAFLDKQDVKTLKMLAGAKIKFISGMAQNRVVRKMNESIGSTIGGALGQYAGSKMGLEGPGRAHGEVLGRQLEKFARELFKKLTKEEASSPAQQAAIAISMKEKGKKPKSMEEQEGSGTAVNQSKRAALSMQMANLKMKQAKEREALQKKREALSDETQIDEYDSKGGVYQHRSGTYGKAKGSEYGDTDFDQENKMQKTLSKIKKAVKKGANQNRRTDTKLYKEEDGSATKDKDQVKNSKKQVVKKGDTLSGKKETIIIEPELKDK